MAIVFLDLTLFYFIGNIKYTFHMVPNRAKRLISTFVIQMSSFLNLPPYDALNVFVCERNCCAAINSAFVCDIKESTDIPFSCETTEVMII